MSARLPVRRSRRTTGAGDFPNVTASSPGARLSGRAPPTPGSSVTTICGAFVPSGKVAERPELATTKPAPSRPVSKYDGIFIETTAPLRSRLSKRSSSLPHWMQQHEVPLLRGRYGSLLFGEHAAD